MRMSANREKVILGKRVISSWVIIRLTTVALYNMPEPSAWRNTSVRSHSYTFRP